MKMRIELVMRRLYNRAVPLPSVFLCTTENNVEVYTIKELFFLQ